jgi:hypothetical protein
MKKAEMFVSLLVCVLLGLSAAMSAQQAGPTTANADAQQRFLQEFDSVCSRTQDAMLLTTDELKDMVRRCDALVPQLQKLDETRRKVYTRRLDQCRGLFSYVLDTKKNGKN